MRRARWVALALVLQALPPPLAGFSGELRRGSPKLLGEGGPTFASDKVPAVGGDITITTLIHSSICFLRHDEVLPKGVQRDNVASTPSRQTCHLRAQVPESFGSTFVE